ncbi:cell division cycle 48 [Rhynchospora pubera]|uniref:Cell division cycle 48 n=1 Tax=Rhynchospora pubera TaxID=906938 RepID=A0AAV8GRL0_9POAL|nr:cell division cycle 48 [Rhynchospora pubera]
MGKRKHRCSGRPLSAGFSGISRLLQQRIVESGLDVSLDAESVAMTIRNRYPEYRRLKLRLFSHQVSQVLASLRRPPSAADTSHNNTPLNSDGSLPSTPTCKRSRPSVSVSESRCLDVEPDHLHCQIPSEMSDEESYGSQSAFTSHGNGIDSEAALDVTKTVLRDSYRKKNITPKGSVNMLTQNCFQVATKSALAMSKSLEIKSKDNVEIDFAAGKPKMATAESGPRRVGGVKEVNDSNTSAQEGKALLRLADLGGMQKVIEELLLRVIVPLRYPELPMHLGVRPTTGFLLHGPPGCGKTHLAHAIANEAGVPFYKISGPEVVSGVSGGSEENVRTLFEKAHRTAPSIVFIDEIDAIASKRENLQKEMDRRIVIQLLTCMDQFYRDVPNQGPNISGDKSPGYVIVIAATNKPDVIDQALRRPGRFDREIALGVPDEAARFEILSKLSKRLKLEDKLDLSKVAKATAGFVGADLNALVDEAGYLAMKRIVEKRISLRNLEEWPSQPWNKAELESFGTTIAEFENAARIVQPSLRREGFSSIPTVTWDDVGGVNLIRKVFEFGIVQRIKHPEYYQEMGIGMKAGFLLFGPPGCGKSLIAQAVANEAGANFIHIKGPELLDKYVGESELAVRKLFTRARANSPCILFFDEVDSVTTSRGKEGGWVVERLLAQLLVELDGVDNRQGVYIIGATNRVDVVDPALLRPGRFGKMLYVPLPGADERVAIMRTHARNKRIDADVDLDALARSERCNNLSGADLATLIDTAAEMALNEWLHLANGTSSSNACSIKASHLEAAVSAITPSVHDKEREYYEALSKKYKSCYGYLQRMADA